MRAEFGSTLAILAAHIKEIDRAVLAGGDVDMAEEPARERLFDVLMRRLEALAPYKEAIRSIMRSVRRSPGLAVALNAMAVRSQHWMLEAAGIRASGPWGALRAQGAALMFARVLSVWVDDEEQGLDRTMAALDRQPETGPTLILIARVIEPQKRFEYFLTQVRGDARTVIIDRNSEIPMIAVTDDCNRRCKAREPPGKGQLEGLPESDAAGARVG